MLLEVCQQYQRMAQINMGFDGDNHCALINSYYDLKQFRVTFYYYSALRNLFSFSRSLILVFSSCTRPLLICSIFLSTLDKFWDICFWFFKLYISSVRLYSHHLATKFIFQLLLSNSEVLELLLDADSVGLAIYVSGSFSRFNEGFVV